jgi:hypothetical protein
LIGITAAGRVTLGGAGRRAGTACAIRVRKAQQRQQLLGLHPRRGRRPRGAGPVEPGSRPPGGDHSDHSPESLLCLRARHADGGRVGQADGRPHQIGEGAQPPPLAVGGAPDREHAGAGGNPVEARRGVRDPGDLVGEAGLAHPGVGGEHQDPRFGAVGDLGESA